MTQSLTKKSDFWTDTEYDQYLNGSGKNDANRHFLARLKRALPESEWLAVSAWISTFYGYQQNWLLDSSEASLLLKSRQSGATFTYAAVAVLWGLLNEDTTIISKGQREANLVLKNVGKHLEALTKLGSRWAIPKAASAERIILSGDGTSCAEITSLPPTSGGRGFSANVILDEFAYYEHPDDTWDAVSAVTTHNWRLRIMSTPNGVGNPFYEAWKEHRERGYRLHTVTVHDAIADGMNLDPAKLLRTQCKNDPRIFGQVYECKFLDSEFQYIPNFMIQEVSKDDYGSEFTGVFYAGLDIGRTIDLTVLTVLQRHNRLRKWCVRKIQKSKRTSLDDIETMVADCFRIYNKPHLTLDATGMGVFPAERLQKKFGISKVHPFVFTNNSKAELATGMYSAFAEKLIWIPTKKNKLDGTDPLDCEILAEDIASIQRKITEANNVVFEAPRNTNGHADRAWSLALGLHAAMSAPTYARM
jgi:phage FluMu gp28-like protein